MLEIFFLVAFGIALAGSLAAGLWDLKTTDIPDEITFLMVALGIFLWYVYALMFGNFSPLGISLLIGTAVIIIGFILYKLGGWGGGDAVLLAGIFYLVPNLQFLFDYIFNFFIVALVYTIVYAIALGFRHPSVFGKAKERLKETKIKRGLMTIVAAALGSTFALAIYGFDFIIFGVLWAFIFLFALFMIYAKAVEKNLFKKRIRAKELKVGDVIESSKEWRGLTAEEVDELRKTKKTVEIKEGVRFGMVFVITLVLTILAGNVLLSLVRMVVAGG